MIRVDRKFIGQALGVVVVVGAASAYPLLTFSSRDVVVAAAVGCLLSVLNALAGSLTVEYAFDKSYGTFVKAVLGGMGVRMVVLLGMFYVFIKVFKLHTIALTLSLLGFYIIFLTLEVLCIQRKVEVRNPRTSG